MSRGPSTFKQRDMTAAAKAVMAAGLEVARVEVDKNGKIVVITTKTQDVVDSGSGEGGNPWDTIG
jgi:hypothetical protein